MKITTRLIVSLTLVVALVAVGSSFYQVREEKDRLESEMERRVIILAESLRESVIPILDADSPERLERLAERFGNRERLQGMVVYDDRGNVLASTADLKSQTSRPIPQVVRAVTESRPGKGFLRSGTRDVYLYAYPLIQGEKLVGVLALFHDVSYIDVRPAPSRTHIKRYRDLLAEIEEMVETINWRFQTKKWKPILFLKVHHSHETIAPFYRAADVCMVTSLHDGMNLVAKEYVAARDDDDGVLILSQFTGASRELKDAIIVNPYDIERMADAIRFALTMEPAERSGRMKRMRATVKEQNVYRWAGDLIAELARLRFPESVT